MSVSWDVLSNPPGFAASTMLLLTDGRVICQEDNTPNWFALTPDAQGSYTGGTWSAIAPTSIWRRYYASAVLASGKLLVAGGEDAPVGDTNVSEIYDPVQNTWTPVPPPPGWANIGDAPCAVLRDGRLLLGDINSTRTVIYDPVAGTWSVTGPKGDRSSEETWTLLRDGSVLTVECNPTYPMASQRYVPAAGTWVDAGSTQADLVAHTFSTEIGPAILLEDGRVVAFGGTGHTAIYTPDHGAGSWSPGPDFPVGSDGQLMTVRDAPACLFPNGRVLCCAGLATGGQGWGGPPAFFEFDPATDLLSPVATPALNASVPYVGRMLLLPTGQVLYASGQDGIAIGTPSPRIREHAEEALEPQITEAPEHLIPGSQHKVSGRRFNGVSQAVSYGDDCTSATNYPLARLRYADGRVVYCRTFGHSTMAVATGHHPVHTTVEIPASAPSGHAHLQIVANGIASDPVEVRVK
jgi:Kelch motif